MRYHNLSHKWRISRDVNEPKVLKAGRLLLHCIEWVGENPEKTSACESKWLPRM